MDKSTLKSIGKCILFGVVWSILLYLLALILINLKDYKIQDVLFIEGMSLVLVAVLSSIGGNSMGLSMQGLGQNNSQYIANANLEVSKMEKDKIGNIKTNLSVGFSTVTLGVSGIIVIVLSFIL